MLNDLQGRTPVSNFILFSKFRWKGFNVLYTANAIKPYQDKIILHGTFLCGPPP